MRKALYYTAIVFGMALAADGVRAAAPASAYYPPLVATPTGMAQYSSKNPPGGVTLVYRRRNAPEYEFKSRYLDRKISFHNEMGYPTEAEFYLLPLMKNHAALIKGKRVLVIGMGTVLPALYAAKLGAAKVVAADLNPLAAAYTEINAQSLGVDKTIEGRDLSGTQFYGPLKAGEKFDLILARVPYTEKRGDTLLMSAVNGLRDRLESGGAGLFLARSYFNQQFLLRYAAIQGYATRFHAADRIARDELSSLLSLGMEVSARMRGIDAKRMGALESPSDAALAKPKNVTPLFGDADKTYYPGMTLIRLP